MGPICYQLQETLICYLDVWISSSCFSYDGCSVTKAMLNRATQLLARDPRLQRRGISVSVVTPGWVRRLPQIQKHSIATCPSAATGLASGLPSCPLAEQLCAFQTPEMQEVV
jgi:NAD(P)-dependent dehydrogenase (short-subunit alcohol dehydrogenase family)